MVTIQIKDQLKTLRYDYNALCAMEDQFGSGISQIFAKEQVGFRTARILLWSALRHIERNVTLDTVGKYIQSYIEDGNSVDKVIELCMKALQESGLMGNEVKETEGE